MLSFNVVSSERLDIATASKVMLIRVWFIIENDVGGR